MEPFKISVVTISFNQAAYLQECIDSVARQSGNWEHIIVDAGSTDGSREIIERNKEHFAHIIFEKDEGPADGLNKGFAKATGTHGYFLNSDDFLLPNAFSLFSKFLKENTGEQIYLFGGWIVDSDGAPVHMVRPTRASLSALLNGSSVLFQQGLFFPLTLFQDVGGFNQTNRTIWDFELVCDCLNKGCRVLVRHDRVGAFRVYPGTISNQAHSGHYQVQYAADRSKINSKFGYICSFGENRLRRCFPIIKKYMRNPLLVADKFNLIFRPKKLRNFWLADLMKTEQKN